MFVFEKLSRSKYKMYNPTRDYLKHKTEYDQSIQEVLMTGNFIMGRQVFDLEKCLGQYVNVKHAISVASGTDALLIALMALDVGYGDEVITVPFTWISTAEVIALLGAKAVFVDIEATTYNMDPKKMMERVTDKTKAIIPVSLYGQIADLEEMNRLLQEKGLHIPIIEDGAQSFGAEQNGHKSCSCPYENTVIGCTSFFPSKPLGCYGDGGCCFTNDDELANKIRAIRTHGGTERFKHKYVGINGRLDTLQAAILLVKMKYFDESLAKRKRNAEMYNSVLKDKVIVPYTQDKNQHCYGQYTIRCKSQEERDRLQKELKDKGVMTSIFYPVCVHTQEAFDKWEYREGDFPIGENMANCVLSLPVYGDLDNQEINNVIEAISRFVFD